METIDEALIGIEGKTILKVDQQLYNDREITITFTDNTSIVIGCVGDDMSFVIADKL